MNALSRPLRNNSKASAATCLQSTDIGQLQIPEIRGERLTRDSTFTEVVYGLFRVPCTEPRKIEVFA